MAMLIRMKRSILTVQRIEPAKVWFHDLFIRMNTVFMIHPETKTASSAAIAEKF